MAKQSVTCFFKKTSLITFFLLFSSILFAQEEKQKQYDEHTYFTILQNIRCLVCPNQSVADSDSDFAAEIREYIQQELTLNNNTDIIYEKLTTKYGDKILYEPPFISETWILWTAPFLLLILIFVILGLFYKRKSS